MPTRLLLFYKRVIFGGLVFLLSFLLLSSCKYKGCIDADDDGSMISSNVAEILPINPDVLLPGDGKPNTTYSGSSSETIRGGTTEAEAASNMWMGFTQKDSKESLYAYEGNKVHINVRGAVQLNGFKKSINMPAKVDTVGSEYFIPMVQSGLTLKGGDSIRMTITTIPKVSTSTIRDVADFAPTVNGVPLEGGLGLYGVIVETKEEVPPHYGNADNWQCTGGIRGENSYSGPGDNLTGCANDMLQAECDSTDPNGPCGGYGYPLNASDTDTKQNYVNRLYSKDESVRQRYLSWIVPLTYWASPQLTGKIKRRITSYVSTDSPYNLNYDITAAGTNYTGTNSDISISDVPRDVSWCRILMYNTWANIESFAYCTHNKYISNWATNQEPPPGQGDYDIARMPYVGAISRWYWESGTCQSIDQKYKIHSTMSLYGGMLTYSIANSNIFWGGWNTSQRMGECSKEKCWASNYGTVEATPTVCSNNEIKTIYPQQYLKTKILYPVAKTSATLPNGNKLDDSILKPSSCRITMVNEKKTSAVSISKNSFNNWRVLGERMPGGQKVVVDSTGIIDHGLRYEGSWSHSYSRPIYGVDFGKKPCKYFTAVQVVPIPFVSCFSGYQQRCSNPRIINKEDCKGTDSITSPTGKVEQVTIGTCKKIIGANTEIQKYDATKVKRLGALIDVGSSGFTPNENVMATHCGVCAKTISEIHPTNGYPVLGASNRVGYDINDPIDSSDACDENSGSQWLTEFVDKDTNAVVRYEFTANAIQSLCNDDRAAQRMNNDRSLYSLTSITAGHRATAMGNAYYGELKTPGSVGGLSETLLYEVPRDVGRGTLALGIAGNGTDISKMFSAKDAADNYYEEELVDPNDEDNKQNVSGYKGFNVTVGVGKEALYGKYMFFYIQEFERDQEGNYRYDTLNPKKHPNEVFKGKTHKQIYDMISSRQYPAIDFAALDRSDGVGNGVGKWIAPVSGKIWTMVYDIAPSSESLYEHDRDGRIITFDLEKSDSSNPTVKDDMSNVLYWNTGSFKVTVRSGDIKNKQHDGGTMMPANFIDKKVVETVKTILFGAQDKTTRTDCKVIFYRDPNAQTRPPPPEQEDYPINWSTPPSQCDRNNGTATTTEVLPPTINPNSLSDKNASISKYYTCRKDPATNAQMCYVQLNNGSTSISPPAGSGMLLKMQRYGDCQAKCNNGQGSCLPENMTLSCSIYRMDPTTDNIQRCLQKEYKDNSCWKKLSNTKNIPFPYGHVEDNDMDEDIIGPGCGGDGRGTFIFKKYKNCVSQGKKRFCDIERWCFPNRSGAFLKSKIEVPINMEEGYDPYDNSITSNIVKIKNCRDIVQDSSQITNCRPVNNGGFASQQCELTNSDQSTDCKKCPNINIQYRNSTSPLWQSGFLSPSGKGQAVNGCKYLGNSSSGTPRYYCNPEKALFSTDLLELCNKYNTSNQIDTNYIPPQSTSYANKPFTGVLPHNGLAWDVWEGNELTAAGMSITYDANNGIELCTIGNAISTTTTIEMPSSFIKPIVQNSNDLPPDSDLECTRCPSFLRPYQRYDIGTNKTAVGFTFGSRAGGLWQKACCYSNQLYSEALYGCEKDDSRNLYVCDSKKSIGPDIYSLCYAGPINQEEVDAIMNPYTAAYGSGASIRVCRRRANLPPPSTSILNNNNPITAGGKVIVGKTCEVVKKCNWHEFNYTPSPPPAPPSENLPVQVSGDMVMKEVCDYDRKWEEGLVYQIIHSVMGNIWLRAVFYLAFIFWVTMRGYHMLIGSHVINISSLREDAVKIGMVVMFASPHSWDAYQRFIVKAFIHFTEGMNVLVASATIPPSYATADKQFGPVDQVFSMIFLDNLTWFRVSALLFSSWFGWIYVIIIIYSFLFYLLTAAKAVIMYLSILIMSSIYMSVGPLFFLFVLFDQTRSYFKNWWTGLVGFVASQLYLFSILALFSFLYLGAIKSLLYFKICFVTIIGIPIVNITLLGWWKRVGTSVPDAIKPFLENLPDSVETAEETGYGFPKVIITIVLVQVMNKFILSPIMNGMTKGANDFGKGLTDGLGKMQQGLGNMAAKAIASPVSVVGGAIAKQVERIPFAGKIASALVINPVKDIAKDLFLGQEIQHEKYQKKKPEKKEPVAPPYDPRKDNIDRNQWRQNMVNAMGSQVGLGGAASKDKIGEKGISKIEEALVKNKELAGMFTNKKDPTKNNLQAMDAVAMGLAYEAQQTYDKAIMEATKNGTKDISDKKKESIMNRAINDATKKAENLDTHGAKTINSNVSRYTKGDMDQRQNIADRKALVERTIDDERKRAAAERAAADNAALEQTAAEEMEESLQSQLHSDNNEEPENTPRSNPGNRHSTTRPTPSNRQSNSSSPSSFETQYDHNEHDDGYDSDDAEYGDNDDDDQYSDDEEEDDDDEDRK